MIRHSSTHTPAHSLAVIASASARSRSPATGSRRAGSLCARSTGTGWWLLLLVGLIGWSSGARAGAILDPEVLFVGDSNCGTSNYGCPVYNSEVNGIGPSSLIITDNQNSSTALSDTVLLMLGFPNTSAPASLPGINVSTGSGVVGGPNVYPSTTTKWDSNGFATAGPYTASSTGNGVYDFIGLTQPGSASESFTNWSAAEQAYFGTNVNQFLIGIYSLTGTGLAGLKSSVTVNFASPLPVGTFAVAYGCKAGGIDSTGACASTGDVYATPFTQSAMVTNGGEVPPQSIPAPGTLALLATSLGILKGARRRARTKDKSSH